MISKKNKEFYRIIRVGGEKGGHLRRLGVRLPAALLMALLLISIVSVSAYSAEFDGWTYESAGDIGITTPPAGVKIALIDTGVSTKRIEPQYLETGKNYVFEGAGTEDLNGHGTRIASLIVGCVTSKGSLPPLAASAKVVPLVYYSHYASGVPKNGGLEAMCAAIYDAVDTYNCKIINISSGVTEPDDRLAAAVLYAEENGVIVVSAVGNDNLCAPERVYYPAAYDTVVSVGAMNDALEVSAFSQRSTDVMVYAPGESLRAASLKNAKPIEIVSGTSYATAFVSALAANLLEENPGMTPEEFRDDLKTRKVVSLYEAA